MTTINYMPIKWNELKPFIWSPKKDIGNQQIVMMHKSPLNAAKVSDISLKYIRKVKKLFFRCLWSIKTLRNSVT